MALYRVVRPISGLINGTQWPEVGGTIEVDADLSGMVEAGDVALVEQAKVEKRPAATAKVETRK